MNESFLDLVQKRYSVRNYSDHPVENEKIMRCLEAARLAPSACNAQPWKFIIVDEPELKNALAALTVSSVPKLNKFTFQAPVLIVVTMEQANMASRFGSWVKKKHFPLIDIGIAAEHFCLQAAAEGLGTCMLGWFDEKETGNLLNIPGTSRPVLIITLGYPADPTPPPKKRKVITEISKYAANPPAK